MFHVEHCGRKTLLLPEHMTSRYGGHKILCTLKGLRANAAITAETGVYI